MIQKPSIIIRCLVFFCFFFVTRLLLGNKKFVTQASYQQKINKNTVTYKFKCLIIN